MVIEFSAKNVVILDSEGNYLYVKELSGSFRKIGAPYHSTVRGLDFYWLTLTRQSSPFLK